MYFDGQQQMKTDFFLLVFHLVGEILFHRFQWKNQTEHIQSVAAIMERVIFADNFSVLNCGQKVSKGRFPRSRKELMWKIHLTQQTAFDRNISVWCESIVRAR